MANQIYKAYKIHILPIIADMLEDETSFAIQKAFSKALIGVSHYFGSPNFSPLIPLERALEVHDQKKWAKTHQKAVKAFVDDASIPLYPLYKRNIKDPFTIVIISTTCSGGNHSVALSIANFLVKQPNIQAFIIDVEEIAQKYDPMMIATDTYTYDMVYSHILQKNNNLDVIKARKDLYREIENYIPNNFLYALKAKVISLSPDLIISTRSYTCDDFSLAMLGVPFRLCHADYELCPSLLSYYRCIPSEMIRFWIPTMKSSMFKPLFQTMNRLDFYNEEDNEHILFTKLGEIMQTSAEGVRQNFELIGYPCANFYEIKDKRSLKKKWGIEPHEIPIFIVMGKYSTASIKNIFDYLKSAKTQLPLKYIFICGKNESLKRELEKSAPSKMVICGLLSPTEMNEVMNISSLGISKAGGATIAESIVTKTPILLIDFYPWEEVNADYLIQIGLGIKTDPSVPLIKQIEDILGSNKVKNLTYEHWENNLSEKIKQLM
ncbi:MAG: hypothetical protein LVR00_07850 [Rhabdochlamydiaceae bacterium]